MLIDFDSNGLKQLSKGVTSKQNGIMGVLFIYFIKKIKKLLMLKIEENLLWGFLSGQVSVVTLITIIVGI